jgi:hypothetical protein
MKNYILHFAILLLVFNLIHNPTSCQIKNIGPVSLKQDQISICNLIDNYKARMPVGAEFMISAELIDVVAFPEKAELYANLYSETLKKGNYQIYWGTIVKQGPWEGIFNYSLTVSFDVYLSNSFVGKTKQTINGPCSFEKKCSGGAPNMIGVLNKEILNELSLVDKIVGSPELNSKIWSSISFKNIQVISFTIGNGDDAACYETNVVAFKDALIKEKEKVESIEKKDAMKNEHENQNNSNNSFWNNGDNNADSLERTNNSIDKKSFWTTSSVENKNDSSNVDNNSFWSDDAIIADTQIKLFKDNNNTTTAEGVITISGKITGSIPKNNKGLIEAEGYIQDFYINSDGSFSSKVILKAGVNRIRIKVNDAEISQEINSSREPVDLRVTLTWNTSNCDIDLYVKDPEESICSYKNKSVTNMTLDVDNTNGYGPENIYVKNVKKGTYTISLNNFKNGERTKAKVYVFINEVFKESFDLFFSEPQQTILVYNYSF